ncbi:MAG: acetate/propionate family kinase [Patescibacteria group bacterium]|nr:acetate/propionate family kinase [Patescibacteria group bacterium]
MEHTSLIINIGSASKKYALYEEAREVARYHFEHENDHAIVTERYEGVETQTAIEAQEYHESTIYVMQRLAAHSPRHSISTIGIRVVAPGAYFYAPQRITYAYKERMRAVAEVAPLHIVPTLEELLKLDSTFPHTPVIGVSDSAFHRTIPTRARFYAIPHTTAEKFDIERFGYHGISMQSIVRSLHTLSEPIPRRTIVCHLGSGSSITALQDGISIDTSMGFTPLEGVPMATRVGTIDPGALLYLMKKLNLSLTDLDTYLNTECGLGGLSGISADIRTLIAYAESGDQNADNALATFAYHVQMYIGAYAAILGGIDLLVFTATIGERSSSMRARILHGLEHMGLVLDQKKNDITRETLSFIHTQDSPAHIAVVPTNEMKEIALTIHALPS